MLSMGRLCNDFCVYSYFWSMGGSPKLTEGSQIIECHVGNFEPVIASEWTPSSSWTNNFLRGHGLSSTQTPEQVVFQIDESSRFVRIQSLFRRARCVSSTDGDGKFSGHHLQSFVV